jgi:hypothetical protein
MKKKLGTKPKVGDVRKFIENGREGWEGDEGIDLENLEDRNGCY